LTAGAAGVRERGTLIGARSHQQSYSKATGLIRVELNSGSEMLTCTHTFFSAYCDGNFRPIVAERLTVAAFELLENGLSYGGIREKVVIELLQVDCGLGIRVTNEAIPARLAKLLEQLERVGANPETVFLEELKRSMSGTNRAMLGLARLAHEARLELFAQVRDRHVEVVAHCGG